MHNPRARLTDAEREARAFLRTAKFVPTEVVCVVAEIGNATKRWVRLHSTYQGALVSYSRFHYDDDDYEFVARRVYRTTVSYFFVRKAYKDECVALMMTLSSGFDYEWIPEILVGGGCPLYEKDVSSMADVQSPDGADFTVHEVAVSLRRRLDVLWLFWSVVPANAFSSMVKHFFS